MRPIRLLPYGVYDPAFTMALDSVLLRRAGEGESPSTLRFYGWSRPTLSLGRSQNPEMLELGQSVNTAGVAVVKRPTGGAVAVHGRDLSYSLTCPFPGGLLPRGPKSCYCTIHRALAGALNRMGYPVECVPEQSGPDYRARVYCGLTLNAYDIVYAGRKVVGSAQRRTSRGFLQHGFILLDEDFGWVRRLLGTKGDEIARGCATLSEIGPKGIAPEPEALQAEILEALGQMLDVEFEPAPITREEEHEAKAFPISPPC